METDFDPVRAMSERREVPKLVDFRGRPFHSLPCREVMSDILTKDWHDILELDWFSWLEKLPLRDHSNFVAGQLHAELNNWHILLKQVDNESSPKVKNWMENKIDINDFVKPFKGRFNGVMYNESSPPAAIFNNYGSCEPFKHEIAAHLEEGLKNGSLELVGRVGEVDPPHLVMPLLMIRGTRKNRLCHDERFLNLFMKSMPFSLEGLKGVPRWLETGDYMASSDEKSAYMGIMLSEGSRTYFGVEFGGWYMHYRVLPFGWSISPYIYQTVGMQVTSFLRMKGVVTSQYIDDRFIGPWTVIAAPKLERTGYAIFLNTATLNALGFTVESVKSLWFPTHQMTHLGFILHSDTRYFELPEQKKEKFRELREQILGSESVDVRLLQKLMGKCISFTLCVAGAKLYVRSMSREIGLAEKCQKGQIAITGDVRDEITFWRFLDDHTKWVKWREERHTDLRLATDASGFGWGAYISENEVVRDLWSTDDKRPIHIKETDALLKTLQSLSGRIENKRIDVRVDNMAVVYAWNNQKSRDPELIKLVKEIFLFVTERNCDLQLCYVASGDNPADAPSRAISLADMRLSRSAWDTLERKFGPHTFDLMALDSNAMQDSNGASLPHFSPWPLPQASGVNVLSQSLERGHNYYCFPPFCMLETIIPFLLHENARPLRVTLVAPMLSPLAGWWPQVLAVTTPMLLGVRGCQSVVEAPSKSGYVPFVLKQDLFALRLILLP